MEPHPPLIMVITYPTQARYMAEILCGSAVGERSGMESEGNPSAHTTCLIGHIPTPCRSPLTSSSFGVQITQPRRYGVAIAPLQIVFLGMRGEEQHIEVTRALRDLSHRRAIQILHVAYTTKQDDGSFKPTQEHSTLSDPERHQIGAAAGALEGFGFGIDGGREGARQGASVDAEAGAQGGDGPVAMLAQEDFGISVDAVRDYIRELATHVPCSAICEIALPA